LVFLKCINIPFFTLSIFCSICSYVFDNSVQMTVFSFQANNVFFQTLKVNGFATWWHFNKHKKSDVYLSAPITHIAMWLQ